MNAARYLAPLLLAWNLTGHAEHWPCWRGPRLDGTSHETGLPVQWSATENVAWKTALPGVDHASPIVWNERLGEHHASLVSAEGRVYFLNDEGVMNVVQPGPEFVRVAENRLGEKTFASPAISQGQLFLRGDRHLFCIGVGK